MNKQRRKCLKDVISKIEEAQSEVEVPQPTIWERIKDAVCFIGALLALIGFGILMLAAISTTKL